MRFSDINHQKKTILLRSLTLITTDVIEQRFKIIQLSSQFDDRPSRLSDSFNLSPFLLLLKNESFVNSLNRSPFTWRKDVASSVIVLSDSSSSTVRKSTVVKFKSIRLSPSFQHFLHRSCNPKPSWPSVLCIAPKKNISSLLTRIEVHHPFLRNQSIFHTISERYKSICVRYCRSLLTHYKRKKIFYSHRCLR